MFDLQVTGQADLQRLARQLRKASDPRQVRRELLTGLRAGARPAVAAAKDAARALPAAAGPPSSGLRRRMARAVTLQIRTGGRSAGVSVRVSRRAMGEQAALARVTNDGRWRHPVYGNTGVWVTQTSSRGWFDRAVAGEARQVRRELARVLGDIEKRLTHH